jgi:small multidrug resistance family-3 protein
MSSSAIARSAALFVVAGLMEIGGGYLVWLWLRERRGFAIGALGGLLLFLYVWGWWIDGHRPDAPDAAGALLCVVGVAVIMYWPRPGLTP